jgi:hypothetical protein
MVTGEYGQYLSEDSTDLPFMNLGSIEKSRSSCLVPLTQDIYIGGGMQVPILIGKGEFFDKFFCPGGAFWKRV